MNHIVYIIVYPNNPQLSGRNINTKESIEREPNTSMKASTLVIKNLILIQKNMQYSRKLAIETNIVFGWT
jgi:hypothetical protein